MTGTNLAVGKRARQSSSYDWTHQAVNAVDGNYSSYSMTWHGNDRVNWWFVDLGKNAVINKVNNMILTWNLYKAHVTHTTKL